MKIRFSIENTFFLSISPIKYYSIFCLDDKSEDFGKQRCWGSVSWGLFSIFGGWLIDYFSDEKLDKNYVPIYYFCLIFILCDFAVAYKIKVNSIAYITYASYYIMLLRRYKY